LRSTRGYTPPPLRGYTPHNRWTPQAQAGLIEALEARQRGEWDRALDLLRRWRAHIDPALLSYLRGSIWLEAGDVETAADFFAHAARLLPGAEDYLAHFMYALNVASSTADRKHTDAILQESAQ